MVNRNAYIDILKELQQTGTRLIAVSKTKPVDEIRELYDLGQRDFGENYVQEMVEKQRQLPADIHWHFIGHLQTNKVKQIASFVHLIHGIDSLKLITEVDKQGTKAGRVIDVLLQIHIAEEETKFGLEAQELNQIFKPNVLEHSKSLFHPDHVVIRGFMGMASFTEDTSQIRKEFKSLKTLFDKTKPLSKDPDGFSILSMGMSSDYTLAIEEGSNMVRIGSLIFGSRN